MKKLLKKTFNLKIWIQIKRFKNIYQNQSKNNKKNQSKNNKKNQRTKNTIIFLVNIFELKNIMNNYLN